MSVPTVEAALDRAAGFVRLHVTALPDRLSAEVAARAAELLSRAERESLPSIPIARRPEFLVSRALARTVLGRYLGCSPPDVLICRRGGRPGLLGGGPVDFNLSHSRRHCAVAVMSGGRVGVDIEEVVDYPARVAGRWYSSSERDWLERLPEEARGPGFFKLWTIKEACGKARGSGLRPSVDVVTEPEADRGLANGLHWRTWWLSSSTVVSVAATSDDRPLDPPVVGEPAMEAVLR